MDNLTGYWPERLMGEVRPDCKPVVVGIDFGTSYSGVTYAFKADPESIRFGAPTAADVTQVKAPTALLQMEDGTWEFGNTAESKYSEILMCLDPCNPAAAVPAHLYKNFKMALCGQNSGFDTLTARSLLGKSHNLMDLVTRTLQALKNFAIEQVSGGWGGALNPANDIQWVLSVPAIWTDFSKAFMRKAAFKAGLMESEQSSDLMLVLEPEAANIAVYVGMPQDFCPGTSSRILVVDCGGGIVQNTVYEVQRSYPVALKVVSTPSGGDWGGDYVSLEFKKFLKELLGPDLYKEQEMPCEHYMISNDFTKVKINFNPSTDPGNIRLIDVLESKKQLMGLVETYNTTHPDKTILMTPATRHGFLTMSKQLMLSFFEPFLKATVDEIRRIKSEQTGITYIILVGAFSASKVLTDRIKSEFHMKGNVHVILPDTRPKPAGAIAHGAVYFGLYKDIIQSRIAAHTYGVAMQVNGVADCFHVLVTKHQEVPNDHEVVLRGVPVGFDSGGAAHWRLYRSNQLAPSTVTTATLVGTINIDCGFHLSQDGSSRHISTLRLRFGGPEIRVLEERPGGELVYKEITMV